MSGHSKWSKIKRDKEANDNNRSKEFSRVTRQITIAAQLGGTDPAFNPTLAFAIEKAKEINMPNENITRAIKKGSGSLLDSEKLEEISYEGYVLGGKVALLIDTYTNNRNRTVGEVRSTIEKNGGTFAESGSISWQFSTIGRILLEFDSTQADSTSSIKAARWNESKTTPKLLSKDISDELELELYDIEGIQEIIRDNSGLEIRTSFKSFHEIKKFIGSKLIKISSSDVVKISQIPVEIDSEELKKVEGLIEKLENLDDVQKVWTNLNE